MKIFLKMLMALVVLAVIAPFYLKDNHGMSLMSLNNLKMPELSVPELPEGVKSAISEMTPSDSLASEESENSQKQAPVRVHKWRDEKGVWHFSNVENPKKGQRSKVVLVDPGKNTYNTTVANQVKKKASDIADDVENIKASPLLPLTHGKETMDQAKKIKELLEKRHSLQQERMQ